MSCLTNMDGRPATRPTNEDNEEDVQVPATSRQRRAQQRTQEGEVKSCLYSGPHVLQLHPNLVPHLQYTHTYRLVRMHYSLKMSLFPHNNDTLSRFAPTADSPRTFVVTALVAIASVLVYDVVCKRAWININPPCVLMGPLHSGITVGGVDSGAATLAVPTATTSCASTAAGCPDTGRPCLASMPSFPTHGPALPW